MSRIKLTDIDFTRPYEGYLWWSDEQEPKIFDNEIIALPDSIVNPFIMEGNLWDATTEASYLIRNIDGEHQVFRFDMSIIAEEHKKVTEYLPHRTNEAAPWLQALKFAEVWTLQRSEECLNFEVLKPAFIAFVGFKKQEEEK